GPGKRHSWMVSILVRPGDWNADALLPEIPPRGAPAPIFRALDQTGAHGIQMHVVELLLKLCLTVNVEHIGLGLPETIAGPKVREIVWRLFGIPAPQAKTAHALP